MPGKRVSSVRLPPADGQPKNRLLAALPSDAFHRLLPDFETIVVRPKQVLQKQGEPLRYVYFPNGGVVSITTVLSEGTTVEAATVGDDGMLGIEAFLSDDAIAPGETLVQVPDTNAERLYVNAFRREIAVHGALHNLMGRYTQILISQMMQSAACNARERMENDGVADVQALDAEASALHAQEALAAAVW